MKKIKLLLFTLLISLISICGVSAEKKLTCKYYGTASARINTNYIITFTLNGDVQTDVIIEKEETYIQEVPSRTEIVDVTNTYKNNIFSLKETDTCPEKVTITFNSITLGGSSGLVQESTENGKNESVIEQEQTGSSQCYNYKSETTCKNSMKTGKVACVWNENINAAGDQGGYCNVDNLLFVGCGGASDIPSQVPSIISMLVNILKIATPIILIFVSIITLVKALAAQKEDEIKKAQSSLIKKIIASALVFFVVSIVQFIVSIVANDEEEYTGFENCLNCFLNNKCETTTYYKTVVGGEDYCTPLTSGETDKCSNIFSSSK